jgi:glutathione S-transferase
MRQINPLGRIPSLVLDGEVLIDPAAILDWLDRELGPEPARAQRSGPTYADDFIEDRQCPNSVATNIPTVSQGCRTTVPTKTSQWMFQIATDLPFPTDDGLH